MNELSSCILDYYFPGVILLWLSFRIVPEFGAFTIQNVESWQPLLAMGERILDIFLDIFFFVNKFDCSSGGRVDCPIT